MRRHYQPRLDMHQYNPTNIQEYVSNIVSQTLELIQPAQCGLLWATSLHWATWTVKFSLIKYQIQWSNLLKRVNVPVISDMFV